LTLLKVSLEVILGINVLNELFKAIVIAVVIVVVVVKDKQVSVVF